MPVEPPHQSARPRLGPCRRVPRHPRGAHLSLLLGPHQSPERPHPGPGTLTVLLEHRRGGLRPHGVPDRRGAPLHHASTGSPANPHDAALLLDGAAGLRRLRLHRLPRVLLSLPRHRHGATLPERGAFHDRHVAAARGDPIVPVVLRRRRPGRSRNPAAGRLDLPTGGLELGCRAAARRQHGLAPGRGVHPRRLDRLQRGDDPQYPRPRLPHTRRRLQRLGQMGERLSVGPVPGAGLRPVRAAVRPRVLARLDRLPRDSGFLHAGPRHRLLRELAPRHLRAPRLCGWEPHGVERLQQPDLGAHGL